MARFVGNKKFRMNPPRISTGGDEGKVRVGQMERRTYVKGGKRQKQNQEGQAKAKRGA